MPYNPIFDPGTHIATAGFPSHHGIADGKGGVIEKSPPPAAQVRRVDLSTFARGRLVREVAHPNGYPKGIVLARAESRLGEPGYSATSNNCEHFANDASTGHSVSRQVTVATSAAVGTMIGAAANKDRVTGAIIGGLAGLLLGSLLVSMEG